MLHGAGGGQGGGCTVYMLRRKAGGGKAVAHLVQPVVVAEVEKELRGAGVGAMAHDNTGQHTRHMSHPADVPTGERAVAVAGVRNVVLAYPAMP